MFEAVFKTMGLQEDLAKIYTTLLRGGVFSVGDLSKHLEIPRASLYGHLQKLHEKGFVVQSINASGVKLFAAESPEIIDGMLRQRGEDLEKARDAFGEMVQSFRKEGGEPVQRPRFEIFEGTEGVRHVLKDMLLYRNLSTSAFWPIKTMLQVLTPEFFSFMNKERIRRKLYTRALWPIKEVVDIKEHPYLGTGEAFQREIRVAPKDIDCSMGYWIYGNKVAFVSSQKEQFAFIIESAELTKMLLTQFEILWSLSKPLVADEKDTEKFLREL